jgi:hypothetical protein
MKPKDLQDLQHLLNICQEQGTQCPQAKWLVDQMIQCGFSFLDAPQQSAQPVPTIEGIEYPNAQFLLKGAKFPGKCIRCQADYPEGEKLFWVKGKGSFCPSCCSDLEHRYYKNSKAKYYYNYLFKLGLHNSETRITDPDSRKPIR